MSNRRRARDETQRDNTRGQLDPMSLEHPLHLSLAHKRPSYLAAHTLRAVLEVVLEDVERLGLRAVVLWGKQACSETVTAV